MLIIPKKTGAAHENMADDLLLLESFIQADYPRFRHYQWAHNALTFGYSQRYTDILSALNPINTICRRPTGGGIVNHTNDWTYALVIPNNHKYYRTSPKELYKIIHQELVKSLQKGGAKAELAPCNAKQASLSCFGGDAENHDVTLGFNGPKIAGAAQKRTKHGLLTQGSIDKTALPEIDWEQFETDFSENLAQTFSSEPQRIPYPEYNKPDKERIYNQFLSEDWNKRR